MMKVARADPMTTNCAAKVSTKDGVKLCEVVPLRRAERHRLSY